ncbi:universal stress protein [soil metagenome]
MNRFPTKILLATDGSEDAALALRAAVDLSVRSGAELHVVHVWQAVPSYPHPAILLATDSDLYEREAQKILFEQLDEVGAAGGVATGAYLERGRPADMITGLSERIAADLVVMGSRGLGPVTRLVVGSVSEEVVYQATRPVLVVRGNATAWPPARVVVGDDSSEGAKRAGGLAAHIGSLCGARVLLVRAYPTFLKISDAVKVVDTPSTLEEALGRHEAALWLRAGALESVLGQRPRIKVAEGEAASVILAAAEKGEEPTLIVVGSRGLSAIDRLRLGSVSTKVLRAATGPVLICPF